MSFRQTLEIVDLLDRPDASAERVAALLRTRGLDDIETIRVEGDKAYTDVIRIRVPGVKSDAPRLGIVGMLGGVGARPSSIGMVSDADGAIVTLSAALKLADMTLAGDKLLGDVILTTHVCPNSPTRPHHPVPFMSVPVERAELLNLMVMREMDAILSVDTSRGNRYVMHNGIALTPTVKEGYILRISEALLEILEYTTGEPPRVMPITTQDITPYENGVFHLNSMMLPGNFTFAPVVGVAITSAAVVPGCATGAFQIGSAETAVRFCLETAKRFGAGEPLFYDRDEFNVLRRLYGSMEHLMSVPKTEEA
jgi:hypothetical protein